MSADDCVFCGIATGAVPASVVAQHENVMAIMDRDPVTPGHVLVLPRAHLPALADLSDALAGEIFALARSVAAALRASPLRCDGVNLFYADGQAALQEVFHAHLHVFPRFPGDGFKIEGSWGTTPARHELDAQASAIRRALDGSP